MSLLYAKSSDEIGHAATLSSSVAMDPYYPVTNIQTFSPSAVGLTLAQIGSGWRLVWDHGSAKDVQAFSLHHHNIPAGTSGVKVQRNAANSWGGPTMDYTLPIATFPTIGLPLPEAVDLRAVAGYSAGGFRYSSLFIPALSQLGGIGSALWWATLRSDIRHVRYPEREGEGYPSTPFPTAYGPEDGYKLGVRRRSMPGSFRQRDGSWAAFLALFRACKTVDNAFLWWSDATGSDGWLAGLSEDDLVREIPINGVYDFDATVYERTCGLAIPTA